MPETSTINPTNAAGKVHRSGFPLPNSVVRVVVKSHTPRSLAEGRDQ